MKPFIWITVVIVLLVAAYFIFAGRDENTEGTTAPAVDSDSTLNETLINETPTNGDGPAETKEETVVYLDSGFSPATLTVPRGTKVTFRNDSRKQMWVASDPHPVHTNLSPFDSREGIAPGGSYSYTFNDSGTWGYHNHLDSGDEGTITVE